MGRRTGWKDEGAAGPTEEERALFLGEVGGARVIDRTRVPPPPPAEKAPLLPDEGREWREFFGSLGDGGLSEFEIRLGTEHVEGRKKGVGAVTAAKLRAGGFSVEAVLDLHGLGRQAAKERVRAFVDGQRAQGRRCVLIVHGRGNRSKGGVPVLKQGLVKWLDAMSGAGRHVLAFVTARPCDGGPGSVYVLLDK